MCIIRNHVRCPCCTMLPCSRSKLSFVSSCLPISWQAWIRSTSYNSLESQNLIQLYRLEVNHKCLVQDRSMALYKLWWDFVYVLEKSRKITCTILFQIPFVPCGSSTIHSFASKVCFLCWRFLPMFFGIAMLVSTMDLQVSTSIPAWTVSNSEQLA